MSSSFLRADGSLEPQPERLPGWLPSLNQMMQGAQGQFGVPPDAADAEAAASPWYTSMRQGMGMVVVAALVAGVLPVVLAWIQAHRLGTVVPFVQAAQFADLGPGATRWMGPFAALLSPVRTLAGMQPALFPGWLAALISAIGVWINWPLRWLAWWIVYGLGVMVGAKLLGATTTLQHFYALTAYAALPLLLLALGPIPYLGSIAALVALIWAAVVYISATRAATGFGLARTVICVAMPAAVAVLLGLMTLIALVATLLRIGL